MAATAEPNVVPLCDVLLVLLIIFMVITPLAQKGIDVKLPETQESGGQQSGVIVMTLHKDYTVDINKNFIEFNMVQDFLAREYAVRSEKIIFVKAEAKVPFTKVVELIDIAKAAGVETIALIPEEFIEENQQPS